VDWRGEEAVEHLVSHGYLQYDPDRLQYRHEAGGHEEPLRWRDIMPAKDREGREIVVLFVQGKGKSRNLVAPRASVTIWNASA
jgi:hypothetical protein